jgi:NAD(P)-dependent dehydrogenase (short-subunit alcohol dehydrogenase family)
MTRTLAGTVALVTDGTHDSGAATVRACAAQGADSALESLSPDTALAG